MITTINVNQLSFSESGKQTILTYADTLVATYTESGYDTLHLLAEAAKLELLAARIKEQAKVASLPDVSQYSKQGITKLGVSMVVKEVGVSYDYSADPLWVALKALETSATQDRKDHEEYLKRLPACGKPTIDPTTGELYRAYPPLRKASDGVVLTIL